jgi:spore maturation protein CgeB
MGRPFVVPVMQVTESRFFPVSYFHETIPYCFDCWDRLWPRFQRCFERNRCRIAFFSARQSADHFRTVLPQMECHWLPEACDPKDYSPHIPLAQRDIDVLELGRRYEDVHQKIVGPLAAAGRVHLYRKTTGMIFPTFKELADGFARTKISVCFPGSMTHKQWAGNVETVTYRYFESMASKCIIYGHCPAELKDLFGYDPTVAADFDRPMEQIQNILANVDAYQPMVDRNYQRLLEVGTWDVRIREMTDILRRHGMSPAQEPRE